MRKMSLFFIIGACFFCQNNAAAAIEMMRPPASRALPRKAAPVKPPVIIKEEARPFAVGGKLLYIIPGLGIQGWLNENVGLSLHAWLIGSTNSGTALYQGNLLFKTQMGKIKPIFGLGYGNSMMWESGKRENGNGMVNTSLGLSLGDENFYFLPALEILSGSGDTVPLFTIGFYWWI